MHQEVEAMAHGLDIAVGGDVHLHAGNGKGRHRIRASFQAVRPKCRQALHPPERRINGDSYTPRPLWTAPQWVERSGPNYRGAMVSKALTPPGVDGCSLYGVSRVGAEAEAKNGQRPRGGPGPLSRALKKSRQREGLL